MQTVHDDWARTIHFECEVDSRDEVHLPVVGAECLHGDVSRADCYDLYASVVCEPVLFVQIAHEENDVADPELLRMRRRILRVQSVQILGG